MPKQNKPPHNLSFCTFAWKEIKEMPMPLKALFGVSLACFAVMAVIAFGANSIG